MKQKAPDYGFGNLRLGIRATGIEPVSHAWEARVLPLNDARMWCAQILAPECESVKQKEKNIKMYHIWLANGSQVVI